MERTINEALEILSEDGVCAVIRHIKEQDLGNFVDAIRRGGIRSIEITLNTHSAIQMIRQLANDPNLLVGAGTVMDGESARIAINAGAQFIVSPHFSKEVMRVGNENSRLTIPGAFTPTEIVTAHQYGAKMIKVFPAGTLGPEYFRNIRGPLPNIAFMATGGIGVDNIQDFIASGVTTVGIGGALASKQELSNGDWSVITERANRFNQSVKKAREV
jgi:2-dehydro-3-deoxyphosphogluconate aldolase / (4S)-4-hydroxy-2-oxoglutarate aldolase